MRLTHNPLLTVVVVAVCFFSACDDECNCPDLVVSPGDGSDWPDWATPIQVTRPKHGDTLTEATPFQVVVTYPSELPAKYVHLFRQGSGTAFGGANGDISGSVTFQATAPFAGDAWLYARIMTTGGDSLYSGQTKVYFRSQ